VEEGRPVASASPATEVAPAAVTAAPAWRPPRSRVDPDAEAAILAALGRARRHEALELLMKTYGAPITAFVIRMVRDRDVAGDVRQQVFLEAFQGFERFEGRSSLWSWLCGIAHHRCIDELRRRRRASQVDDLESTDALAGPAIHAIDADRVAQRRALEQCLAKLTPAIRTQLLMRCFLGLTYAEIGDSVGATHSAVQVRMSRILPRLRRCLRDEGLAR
jgi:RNA polymerase sigma-70 factor (ECF subfamily)